LCLPQGGITKRKGFQFISANPDTSTPDGGTALTMVTTGFYHKSRMFPFVFADGQEFIILMEPSHDAVAAKLHIFYQDSRVATLTNGVEW
jgi:hypothetical protein